MPTGTVIVLVFFLMTHYAKTLSICPYGTYQLKDEPGCYVCPKCQIGSGLNNYCRRFPPYEAKEEPRCVSCKDGMTFSNISSSIICTECSSKCSGEDNLTEILNCTRYHDRLCGCKLGYFRRGTERKCDQECCYCSESLRHTSVKKCVDDNMPGKKYCAPLESNGRCNEMSYQTDISATIATKITLTLTMRPSIGNISLNHGHIPPRALIFITRPYTLNTSSTSRAPIVRSSQRSASNFTGEKVLILVVALILLLVLVIVLLYMKCRRPSDNVGQRESDDSSEYGTRRYIPDRITDRISCLCLPPSRTDPYFAGLEDIHHHHQYEEDESLADHVDHSEEQEEAYKPRTYLKELTRSHKQRLANLLDSEDDWLPLGEHLADGNEELTYRIRNSNRVPRTSTSPSKILFRYLVKHLPNLVVDDFSRKATTIGRQNVIDYINDNSLHNWIFSRLPFPHMNRLAYLLDQKLYEQGDWSELATALGLPQEKINSFRLEVGEPAYSPTIQILDIIQVSCPLMKLSEIKNAADSIERNDVADCIDSFINGTVDKLSQANCDLSMEPDISEVQDSSAKETLLE